METTRSIREPILPGDWAVSIDLKDTCLHIKYTPDPGSTYAFCFQGRILQFKVLPLGLTTAPFIFTKMIMAVAAHIRKTGSLVIQYFDDWLLHSASYPINSQSNICLANNTNIRSDPKYRIVGTNTDSDLHRAFIRI